MSESARSILRHLYEQGRMTEWQYDKIDRNLKDRPHGEWEKYGDKIEAYDIAGNKSWGQKRRCTNCGFIHTYIEDFGFYSICPNCGADMQVKNELNRVSKELNSEIEKSKSEIVPDYRDGWRLREGEAK